MSCYSFEKSRFYQYIYIFIVYFSPTRNIFFFFLNIFSPNTKSRLKRYQANPSENWREKNVCTYLISALTVTTAVTGGLATEINTLVPLLDYFQTHILSDLEGCENVVLQAGFFFLILFLFALLVFEFFFLLFSISFFYLSTLSFSPRCTQIRYHLPPPCPSSLLPHPSPTLHQVSRLSLPRRPHICRYCHRKIFDNEGGGRRRGKKGI